MTHKVLSLLQPWASLVVMGYKRIETRGFNTKYGGPLLIHASKGTRQGIAAMLENGGQNNLNRYCNDLGFPLWADLPFGAIIGRVNLLYTSPTETLKERLNERANILISEFLYPNSPKHELAFGDYSPGRYGWLLSDHIQFKEPIPCKGSQGFWKYEGEISIPA